MLAENKIVHGLWIGSTLSNLELLTLFSFIEHGHEFWLWTYNKIETPLPSSIILKDANEIIPSSKVFRYKYSNQYGHGKGSYAGFSDIFRYALLYKYGGWWVDMDVTCLQPLDFNQPFVFRKHHYLAVVGNIMKCPRNSELMKRCYEEALICIDENNRNWNKPIEILNKNIASLNLKQYILDFTNEDKWFYIRNLLIKEVNLPNHFKALHWINEEWRRHNINKNQFLPSSTYGKLMNKYNIKSLYNNNINMLILRIKLSKMYSLILLLTKPYSWKFIFLKIAGKSN